MRLMSPHRLLFALATTLVPLLLLAMMMGRS